MNVRTALWWAALTAVLVPALLLTYGRLSAGDGEVTVRLVAFAPYAVGLYAVAVLVVLATVVRGPRTAARLLTVAVALTGLGLHVWWAAPLLAGPTPAVAAESAPLRVMTANLRLGQGDAAALAEYADRQRVELLVVQEITPRALATMERAGIAAAFPHRAGRPAPGASGTMVFSRTRIGDVERLPTGMGSWALRVAGLRVHAVHPAYPVTIGSWRREQRLLHELVTRERPDLVIGDFNATLDHASLRDLLAVGYRDSAELSNAGLQRTWPANGRYRFLGLSLPRLVGIDHVLVGPGLTASRSRTVLLDGTDHAAVVADVVRPGPRRAGGSPRGVG